MACAEGDAAALRVDLEASQAALAALQRNFDDFQESSRELEEELEAELGRAQDQVSELTNRVAEVAARLGEQQARTRALASEVAAAQAESARLRAAAAREAAEKAALEQANDELEEKVRAAVAAEDDFRHKLDLAIEEKIFVSNDLEDLRAEALRTEQTLRSNIEDLQQELGRIGSRGVGSRPSTPSLILPSGMKTPPVVLNRPETSTAAPGCGDSGSASGELNGSIHGAAKDPEAADDLIKALEEEVEALTSQLQESEAANDDLNLELQDMQEQLLDRGEIGVGAGGIMALAGVESGGAKSTLQTYEAEITTLKEDLSEAMAMCEELDQTVTDLTDELHSKDEQHRALEESMARLEAEMGSRTQSLEDEVSKARTSASSLGARVADAEAELRASNGRLEDASSKATAAQEREGKLREELASLRERVSELTASTAALSEESLSREGQLEEAVALTEKLRDENGNLRMQVDSLTALLSDETAARRLAEKMAEDRLQAEIAAERERSAGAAAAAAAATAGSAALAAASSADRAAAALPTTVSGVSSGSFPERHGDVGSDDGGEWRATATSHGHGRGGSGGGQGEGQSSGEPPAAGAAAATGGGITSADSLSVDGGAAGQTSASEKELGEQVVRLKKALQDVQRRGGGRGGAPVDGASSAVSSALESDDIDAVKEELRALAAMYVTERGTNASLLSKIRALKGNIEVICRIRPPTAEETAAGVPIALEALGEGEVGVKISKDATRPGGQPGSGAASGTGGHSSAFWRSFTLDKAFGPSTSQEEVFRQVEPLALSAADGMNACIFAYGQTGSGKTHTMIGDPKGGEMAGVSYRTMNKLFQVLGHRQQQQPDYTFSVRVAMLEIYNEDARDLLMLYDASNTSAKSAGVFGWGSGDVGGASDGAGGNSSGSGSKLEIRRGPDGMIQVPGLTHVTVSSAEEVLKLLEQGGSARAVAATGVHDHSSRSHSVLLAEVASRAGPDALPQTGRLFLVDLAGSERIKVSGVTGAGLREATNINSSLSALGDVMQALDQKHKHVPYRNSKLTFLLQDALGGNSRTAMVVTVCPTSVNVDETLFALQFAARARNVSLGPAQKNVGAKNLLEEGKELRAKLREAGRKKDHAEEALATLQREHARSQQKMGALLDARAKNVGDLRSQLEAQIDSLKTQLAEAQASVLVERNMRSSLQAESEDYQRQLRRSLAKVTALGRDREERESKLYAKQEEIGELKAELRKTVSDAKNTVRRLSAGRSGAASGAGAFGFTPRGRGSEGDGIARGISTPSKKLSEAKSRYARSRENSVSRLFENESSNQPPPSPEAPLSMPRAPRRLSYADRRFSLDPPAFKAKTNDTDTVKLKFAESGTTSAASNDASSSDGLGAVEVEPDESAAETSFALAPAGENNESTNGVTIEMGLGIRDGVVDDNGSQHERSQAAGGGRDDDLVVLPSGADDQDDANAGGEAADAAAAIAAATAIFARTAGRNGGEEIAGTTGERVERRGSLPRPRSGGGGSGGGGGGGSATVGAFARTGSGISGVSSRLTRGTVSSMSRLRVSAPPVPAFDGAGGGQPSASRTGRRSSVKHFGTMEETPGPASSRNRPPSPSGHTGISTADAAVPAHTGGGRVSRTIRLSSSSSSSTCAGSHYSGPVRSGLAAGSNKPRPAPSPASRAARYSFSGLSAGSGENGATTTSNAARPLSPVSGAATTRPMSSRASVGHSAGGPAGAGKGWLGETSRGGSLAANSASAAAAAAGEGGREGGSGAGGSGSAGQTRAQIALKRHQERMDRIREKREERKGSGGKEAPL